MPTYGTDLVGLGQFDGDITTDSGATIISTNSDGSEAILMGSAPIRSIHSGITNGDFAALPDEPDTDISDDNSLPYFKWDNTSGTAFRAVIASDNAFVGDNRVVRVLVGTAIATGTATLTRIEPIGATGGVGNAFVPSITVSANSSAGSGVTVKVGYQFLAVDQSTVLGTVIATQVYNWDSFVDGYPDTAYATIYGDTVASVHHAAPAGAEFIKTIVTFGCTAAGGSAYDVVGYRSIDIVDIGFERGSSTIYLNENGAMGDFAPGVIEQVSGTVKIASGLGTPPGAENAAIYVGVEDSDYPEYGQIVLDANSGQINLLAAGGVTMDSSLDVAGSIDATGIIAVARASASNEAFTARVTADGTARFAVFCNGAIEWGTGGAPDLNLYRASAGLLKTDFALAATNISLTGSQGVRHDAPATTTQTSSAGIWVLVSGTNYQLRRNSSSARYKTNIVDADEVVLDAARKIKPRHYESTIEDEAGATRLGFIAEEVHDAGLTHAVGYDSDGKPETIDATALIAALWHRVNNLEQRLKEIETK